MSGFFGDLKVVELATVLAGPAAGMFFAELGAEVIKVENKRTGGDVTRQWRTPGETEQGPSAYFCAVNYQKEHCFLDLSDKADLAKLHHILSTADLVLANQRSANAKKYGLSYDELTLANPRLIYIQLDGYVDEDRPAYDVVLQAETGWISMTGTTKGEYAKLPVALIDVLAGHQMKEAALLALLNRQKTGRGSYVRVTLEQASLAALANQGTNCLMAGRIAEPMGTKHPNIAPYGDNFVTEDGKTLVLAVGSDKQFAALSHTLGRPGWIKDQRFAGNSARLANRATLVGELQARIGRETAADLSPRFLSAGVPFGIVRHLGEVLAGATAKRMVRHQIMDDKNTARLTGLAYATDFLQTREDDAERD